MSISRAKGFKVNVNGELSYYLPSRERYNAEYA